MKKLSDLVPMIKLPSFEKNETATHVMDEGWPRILPEGTPGNEVECPLCGEGQGFKIVNPVWGQEVELWWSCREWACIKKNAEGTKTKPPTWYYKSVCRPFKSP
jgi:hypothetical protein